MNKRSRRRDGLGAVAVLCGLAAAVVLGGLGGVRALRAADSVHSQHLPPTWHAVETANFRILAFGQHGAQAHAAEACEAVRERLIARWHLAPGTWTPKCEIVLHPTREAYLREVGAGGRNTLGSALVDRRDGRIVSRRVDVCGGAGDWIDGALAHELTHVVLADRFAGQPLPRWVDEGAAILADPPQKQRRHQDDFRRALARRDVFRVHELVSLGDYPPPARWGTFYGQSADLVEFMVGELGEQRFLAFVERSQSVGYERAMRDAYHVGIAELERRWQARVANATRNAPSADMTAAGDPPRGSRLSGLVPTTVSAAE